MTGDNLRVCYVVNAVSETSVPADIASALNKYTDVEVDILAWFDVEPFDADDRMSVTCVSAPDTTVGADPGTIRRAASELTAYDIVQAHHNHSGSFAKVIATYLGIPSVSREGNMRKGFTRLGRVANGLTNALADRVVCNSHAVYESFRRWENSMLPRENVAFIPNGVDFDRIDAGRNVDWSARETAGIDDGTVAVGTAGLLTEQKDHATLIRAIANANERSQDSIELVIAGDGPKEPMLRSIAAERGIEDQVHFLGYLDRRRVYKMLSEIDIYAMPSMWEGFSAAAVEGIALGNPAVFSDILPFTEPYGDIARFHAVGDSDGLAEQLVDLAADPKERDRLAAAGRSLVENKYKIERVATEYRDLYHEIRTE